MAQTIKADQVDNVTLSAKATQDGIAQINTAKDKASEQNGTAAKYTKDFCDKYALNKQAVTAVARLKKKDPAEQSHYLRTFIQTAGHIGLFNGPRDQFDDDVIEMMRRVVKGADEQAARKEDRLSGPASVPPKAETTKTTLTSVN
ncbi:hypothetical protein SAMN05444339_10250 [Loktanella atrilutea]|uniref:Uncharacterized protein n=1 Tax=Loktanella atrilutea TaxID=366533 RepID=A0A1M4WAQ9_LOKAT|nr:hypothetical protein [Loktanella atrilutea]SHE78324.1 hypothetical protein SAMN05444339_10250 [Loktanella atrilutea]